MFVWEDDQRRLMVYLDRGHFTATIAAERMLLDERRSGYHALKYTTFHCCASPIERHQLVTRG